MAVRKKTPTPALSPPVAVAAPVAATATSQTDILSLLNATQKKKRVSKAHKNAMTMRAELWPGLDENRLWRRNVNDGFSTIPRTLSLIASIIDDLAKKETGKSQAAGKTYFGLWCRVWDENLLIIENETAYALEAGYPGERNTTTWRSHMRVLQRLGFIEVRDGAYGPFNYVLLLNPYIILRGLKDQIPQKTYSFLLQRSIEIGAQGDLLENSGKEEK